MLSVNITKYTALDRAGQKIKIHVTDPKKIGQKHCSSCCCCWLNSTSEVISNFSQKNHLPPSRLGSSLEEFQRLISCPWLHELIRITTREGFHTCKFPNKFSCQVPLFFHSFFSQEYGIDQDRYVRLTVGHKVKLSVKLSQFDDRRLACRGQSVQGCK